MKKPWNMLGIRAIKEKDPYIMRLYSILEFDWDKLHDKRLNSKIQYFLIL